MKKLRKLNFTRTLAGVAAFGMLSLLLLTALMTFTNPQKASAQATNQFKWVNAGTITSANAVYFDSNPGDDNHEFVNNASGKCTYANAGRNNIPNDKIYVDNINSGTHFTIDQNHRDGRGTVDCFAPGFPVTALNQANAQVFLYRSGDNIMRYDGKLLFSKVQRVVNDSGTTNGELFIRTGEANEPCPDAIVHGTNGAYSGWFIFMMAPQSSPNDGNVSEHYEQLGLPNNGAVCRTASMELGGAYCSNGGSSTDVTCSDGSGSLNLTSTYIGNVVSFPMAGGALGDDAFRIQVGMPDASVAGPPPGTAPGDSDANADEGPPTACDVSFNFATALGFKWIICPFVNILMSTIAWLEDFLTSQLSTNTDPLKPDTPYHAVWGSFRTLALGIIIVVALVMVIFEATGIEAFSAYTVRTLFTRFGVAVLFIVLSWSILGEVVNIVNIITDGARSLIYAPFNGKLGPGADLTGLASFMLLLLGTGGILALGPWGLLSFVLTAVLSVFVTVLVLVVVHALIYILIMFAPVAIALSVLPNTRKGYEFWKNALASVLIGLIAVAFAMPTLDVIAASTYSLQGGSTLYQIIALLIKFSRVFIVLFIFSRIGGALGTITGMVNDRSRGAFDRLKKFRGDTMKNRHQQRMDGGMKVFGSDTLGAAYRRAGSARNGGLSLTQRGRARYEAHEQKHQAAIQAQRLKEDGGRAAGNDDANEIAAKDGMTRQKFVQQYMSKTNSSAKEAEIALAELEAGYGADIGTKSFQATAWKALLSSNTSYKPDVKNPTQHYKDIISDATRMVNNGTMSMADAVAAIKSNSSRPDRAGLSFGSTLTQLSESVERSHDPAKLAANGGELINDQEVKDLSRTVRRGTNPGALVSQRWEAVAAQAPGMMEDLEAAQLKGNKEFQRELAAIAGKYDAMSQIAPQNAEIMADQVLGKQIMYKGEMRYVQEVIEDVRMQTDGSSQEFDNMRKEFKQRGISDGERFEATRRATQDPSQNPGQGSLF